MPYDYPPPIRWLSPSNLSIGTPILYPAIPPAAPDANIFVSTDNQIVGVPNITTAFFNIFIFPFLTNANLALTDGSRNVCIGDNAGAEITTGISNHLYGDGAGKFVSTGVNNICIGSNAGAFGASNKVVTGSDNVFIGASASPSGASHTSAQGRIGIGKSVTVAADFLWTVGAIGTIQAIKEGSNAAMGAIALIAGTRVVSNVRVTANSRIFLTAQNTGGTPGALRVSARTAGVSFTITSTSATDTSLVAWEIKEPG